MAERGLQPRPKLMLAGTDKKLRTGLQTPSGRVTRPKLMLAGTDKALRTGLQTPSGRVKNYQGISFLNSPGQI